MRIVEAFRCDSAVMMVHSDVVKLNRDGHELGVWQPPIAGKADDLLAIAIGFGIHIGATGAYRRAVFERFGRDHVYVVSDGTAQRRPVVVAARARGQAVLESGVTAGDQVIVAGLERVVPDGAVNVVPAEQASAQSTTARSPHEGDVEPGAP